MYTCEAHKILHFYVTSSKILSISYPSPNAFCPMALPRSHMLPNKMSSVTCGILLTSGGSEVPEKLPKQCKLLPLLLVSHYNLMVRFHC